MAPEQEIQPGDWYCLSCKDHQFKRNLQCRSCGTPKLCGTPKPVCIWCEKGECWTHNQIVKPSSGVVKPIQPPPVQAVVSESEIFPGDWRCLTCGDHQFAKNLACRKCATARTKNDTVAKLGSAGVLPFGDLAGGECWKSGDWHCPRCSDHQFAKNSECRRCAAPRPNIDGCAKDDGSTTRAILPVVPSPSQMLPGDWICPQCGDLQFARNWLCRRCAHPRPEETAPQWRCSVCNELQSSKFGSCKRCHEPRRQEQGLISATSLVSPVAAKGDMLAPPPLRTAVYGRSMQESHIEIEQRMAPAAAPELVPEASFCKDVQRTDADRTSQSVHIIQVWHRFATEDGAGCWWWHERNQDCFLEANPAPWRRCIDPLSGGPYWCNSSGDCFWEHSGATRM